MFSGDDASSRLLFLEQQEHLEYLLGHVAYLRPGDLIFDLLELWQATAAVFRIIPVFHGPMGRRADNINEVATALKATRSTDKKRIATRLLDCLEELVDIQEGRQRDTIHKETCVDKCVSYEIFSSIPFEILWDIPRDIGHRVFFAGDLNRHAHNKTRQESDRALEFT